MTSPDDIVIVGGGLAGLRTAERLRARGHRGRIRLLAAESHLPYDRPPLSKQALREPTSDSTLRTTTELADLGLELLLGDPVVAVDAEARAVLTESGTTHGYDDLVLATGAVPRRLPGLGGSVLRTLDDARGLRGQLRAGAAVTVVGAGLIGCEVAASARALGVQVDLVDTAPGPMIRVLGPVVAAEVARLHTAHGVRLHLSSGAIRNTDGSLVTADGTRLGSDVVVEAVGALPDLTWLAESGLPVQDGIVCDASGRVRERIHAVGDAASWDGHRSEHWTSAVNQADVVAATILGDPAPESEVDYWWSDQYDLKIQGIGRPGPDDEVELLTWGPKQRQVAIYSADGLITGAVGFSAAGAMARLRAEVAAQAPLAQVLERLAG